MNDVKIILKALEYAANRHKNQLRKGKDRSPYINHPIQVANLLANTADETDPILLCAAILHDVIEDTVEGEYEKQGLMLEIRAVFGEEILNLTMEVTDDKSLEKAERKRLQIEHAGLISDRAKKLKIADKILNVSDITNNPPQDWPLSRILEYFNWAEKVVDGLRSVSPVLEKIFDDVLAGARAKYAE